MSRVLSSPLTAVASQADTERLRAARQKTAADHRDAERYLALGRDTGLAIAGILDDYQRVNLVIVLQAQAYTLLLFCLHTLWRDRLSPWGVPAILGCRCPGRLLTSRPC